MTRALAARRHLIKECQLASRLVHGKRADAVVLSRTVAFLVLVGSVQKAAAWVHGQERRVWRLARQAQRREFAGRRFEAIAIYAFRRSTRIRTEIDKIVGAGSLRGSCQRVKRHDPCQRRKSRNERRPENKSHNVILATYTLSPQKPIF